MVQGCPYDITSPQDSRIALSPLVSLHVCADGQDDREQHKPDPGEDPQGRGCGWMVQVHYSWKLLIIQKRFSRMQESQLHHEQIMRRMNLIMSHFIQPKAEYHQPQEKYHLDF